MRLKKHIYKKKRIKERNKSKIEEYAKAEEGGIRDTEEKNNKKRQ